MRDLSFRYVGRRLPALRDVSLDLEAGEAVLLLGRSGSGKSTLALCLNGLIPHAIPGTFSGQVLVDGLDTAKTPVHVLAQRVGLIFQDPDAQLCMITAAEEVAFGLENLCTPPDQIEPLVAQALTEAGLAGLQDRQVDRLSGGQKQRLALAAALALRPRLLVFDEPTANLDPQGAEDVFASLRSLKTQGRHALLIVEHRLDGVMDLVDRVVVLDTDGGVLVDGPPRSVFTTHGDHLRRLGIWQPQVTELAQRLTSHGLYHDPLPLTLDEAVRGFGSLVSPHTMTRAAHETGCRTSATDDVGAGGDGRVTDSVSELGAHLALETTSPAAEVQHLSFAYGRVPVLRDVSCHVPHGDFMALVGPNGAGKTTLAALLTGLLRPPSGTVLVQGQDVRGQAPADLARRIGYVFQNPEHQFLETTVEAEIAYGLRVRRYSPAEVARRTAEALERFGLTRYARAHPYMLSYGEKRRLSVATALVLAPAMLILDEPTFGQDAGHAAALLDWLATLHASGRTLLVITHDVTTVARYARGAAVLAGGSIRWQGTARDLFAAGDVLTAARLTLPPLGIVAHRLGLDVRHWLTIDDWEARLIGPAPRCGPTGLASETCADRPGGSGAIP